MSFIAVLQWATYSIPLEEELGHDKSREEVYNLTCD